MLLRFLGWDGFVTSRDVVACLRDAGLEIADAVTSKRDLRQGPGPVQRLAQGNEPALRAALTHLRDVRWGKLLRDKLASYAGAEE